MTPLVASITMVTLIYIMTNFETAGTTIMHTIRIGPPLTSITIISTSEMPPLLTIITIVTLMCTMAPPSTRRTMASANLSARGMTPYLAKLTKGNIVHTYKTHKKNTHKHKKKKKKKPSKLILRKQLTQTIVPATAPI